jgi:hypothetical protein
LRQVQIDAFSSFNGISYKRTHVVLLFGPILSFNFIRPEEQVEQLEVILRCIIVVLHGPLQKPSFEYVDELLLIIRIRQRRPQLSLECHLRGLFSAHAKGAIVLAHGVLIVVLPLSFLSFNYLFLRLYAGVVPNDLRQRLPFILFSLVK